MTGVNHIGSFAPFYYVNLYEKQPRRSKELKFLARKRENWAEGQRMAEVQWEAGDFQEPPSPYRDVIVTAISDSRDKLQQVSQDIWATPEMSFSEVRAHDNITSYLSGAGFQVERGYVLPTGFKAEFSSSHEPDSPDSNSVAFICEYDALPDIGHAAGHNLTSASSIAAALALKTCMEKGLIKGKVRIIPSQQY